MSGGDADYIVLLLNLVLLVGLEVDLGADAQVENGGEVEKAAALLGEDLELGNDVRHCVYRLGPSGRIR